MRVVVNEKYKSLTSEIDLLLPDFVIISGLNGAGKSHLLKAIEEKAAKIYSDDGVEIKSVKYVNSNSLTPNESYQVGRESFTNEVNSLYNSIQSFVQQKRNQPHLTIQSQFSYNPRSVDIIEKIMELKEKLIEEVDYEDISEQLPIYHNLVQDVFYQNFSAIFKRYSDKYDENAYNEFLKTNKGKNKKFLSEEKFIKKYGSAPWEFVNRIFEEANIGYSINDPIEGNRDTPYFFKLINKANGANVNFSDLSSGEKVLMSLTLALYNSKFDVPFPEVLLLDEPDAPLHPSMAKQLLTVIQEVFVKEKQVKVIMTTHSPTTIAMAPEEALFIMQKESPRLLKKSQEQIMKLLTEGIPSFSVYADSRRQVFVESSTDAEFYTKIYGKLKKHIQSDKSLYFISSGVTKGNTGNCEQVKEIVKLLSDNGSQTVYGIIDWDKKNNNTDKVHVLGWQQRYSVENYVFDPIILANFILREKILLNDYFGLSEDEKYFQFPTFEKEKLQIIVNKITEDISKKLETVDGTKTLVHYQGKLSIEVPTWYLQHQGHSLEDAIKDTYPSLKKFQNLKREIVSKVIDDLPEFISIDLLTLFQGLHN